MLAVVRSEIGTRLSGIRGAMRMQALGGVGRGRDISQHARSYLSGLLGRARRKNIGRIEEDVSGSNYQAMQQLVSDSPGDHQAFMSS